MKEPLENQNPKSSQEAQANSPVPRAGRGPLRFGRGVYGSKDAPIRVLDACIALMVLVAVALTVWNAVHGGFVVHFEDGGADTPIEDQSIRYGKLIEEPETPLRPGYTLKCWSSTSEASIPWQFDTQTVTGDMTLYAVWEPASITVKFDLDGGTLNGENQADPITVVYGQTYGDLPQPEKEGFSFGGWSYSGQLITSETQVTMTGEHVLTALWQ